MQINALQTVVLVNVADLKQLWNCGSILTYSDHRPAILGRLPNRAMRTIRTISAL